MRAETEFRMSKDLSQVLEKSLQEVAKLRGLKKLARFFILQAGIREVVRPQAEICKVLGHQTGICKVLILQAGISEVVILQPGLYKVVITPARWKSLR